jgi:hypothetical protein
LGLDDFYLDENAKSFFRDAAHTIYEWLPTDKKIKLGLELTAEGLSNIEELSEKERFFRLLHFLEVNFVKVVDWAAETLELLRKVNEAQKNPSINDVELGLFEKEKTTLYQILKELSETEIGKQFNATLAKLQVEEEYKRYIITIKEVGKRE